MSDVVHDVEKFARQLDALHATASCSSFVVCNVAADLIREQQAEIERLRAELDKRLEPGQVELLMRSLETATGADREEIECHPFRTATNHKKMVEHLVGERDEAREAARLLVEDKWLLTGEQMTLEELRQRWPWLEVNDE